MAKTELSVSKMYNVFMTNGKILIKKIAMYTKLKFSDGLPANYAR